MGWTLRGSWVQGHVIGMKMKTYAESDHGEQQAASLEHGVVGGTLMGLHVLDGKLELLALLVPFMDGHEEQLLVHFAAHDEEVGSQAVQLGARTVGAVLDVQDQLLQVLLPQHALLQHLLLLLRRDQLLVSLLLLHLFDFHLEGWEMKREKYYESYQQETDIYTLDVIMSLLIQKQ